MKKIKLVNFLLITVLCLGFTSCTDDEVYDPLDLTTTWNVWTVTQEEGYYYEDGFRQTYNDYWDPGEWLYILFEDNTGIIYEGDYRTDVKWRLKDGNILVINDRQGGEIAFTILHLDRKTLVMEYWGRDSEGELYWKLTLNKYSMPV